MRCLFYILTMAVLFVGCTPDFDPQTDSDQRNATFRFNTEHLFDDVLSFVVDDVVLGGGTIADTQRIRITAFCYDDDGVLLDKAIVFAKHGEAPSVTFRHLMKDTPYHFIFLGDVAEYKNETDYVERWFHINYQQLDRFYTKLFEYSSRAEDNALWHCDTTLNVENQIYEMPLNKITHNGYICFINTSDVERVSTACTNNYVIKISPFSGIDLDVHTHTFNAPIANKQGFGYTIPNVDSVIAFSVALTRNDVANTIVKRVDNHDRRPFLIFFNCQTKDIEQINYY